MTLPALVRSLSLSFFFPLLRITLLSLHISSYLLLHSYSTRSHHSQYSLLNVVFMNGNYDFYLVTKKVIVFKLQIFCPKTPAPPTIPDSRAIILYLRPRGNHRAARSFRPLPGGRGRVTLGKNIPERSKGRRLLTIQYTAGRAYFSLRKMCRKCFETCLCLLIHF